MDAEFQIDFGNGYVVVAPPLNKDAISIDVIFTKDKARATIQSITFDWVGDTAKQINAYKEAGLTGGKGIAYGLPLKIVACDNNLLFFDLMLNLAHEAARFECDRVSAPIRESGGSDWFEKETQAFYFWNLANLGIGQPGKISFSDYKKTPYLRNDIPNGSQIVTLLITEFMIVWQGIELIDKISELIGDLAADIGGVATVTSTVWAIIQIVWDIILIVAYIIYFYILINMFVKLLKDIIDNFMKPFPPKKIYKLCMREADLFLKLTAYIGVSFSSSIYGYSQSLPTSDGYGGKFVNATWMPRKIVMPETSQPLNILSAFERPENEVNNLKSYGYFDGTADEFCKIMEAKYNAEGKLINGVYHFEENHYWNKTNPYIIPNTAEVGYTFNQPNPHGTNLHELAPTTHIAFQIDESELNTLHKYRGTTVDVTILSPFPVNKNSGWGQGRIIDLGSALAKRKEFLNEIEVKIDIIIGILNGVVNGINSAITALITPLNAAIGIFGGNGINIPQINPIPTLQNRIGWMELSNDSFSVPKTFIGVDIGGDWELHPNTEVDMSAKSLLDNFHGKELATRGNQWKTFFEKKSKFCCSDFAQILDSNVLQTPDSPPKSGKFTAMVWNLSDDIAENTDYRINELYLSGLKEEIKIDGTTI